MDSLLHGECYVTRQLPRGIGLDIPKFWREGVGPTRASPLYLTCINNGKAAGKTPCNEIPLNCNNTLNIPH